MDRHEKKPKIQREDNSGDLISRLPDELIHQIFSFSDARLAVQSSLLSRRWKLVWTTLPFLNFGRYSQTFPRNSTAELEFIKHVLSNRNNQSRIEKMKLYIVHQDSLCAREWFRDFAISHNVRSLEINSGNYHRDTHKLSPYRSRSLEQLNLAMTFNHVTPLESDKWSLPALKTLDLTSQSFGEQSMVPVSYLTCLSSLKTLRLDGFDLPESFSLLSLTTLCLARCNLPQGPWKFPALISLELHDVSYPTNAIEFFSALVSLQNLTIFFRLIRIEDCLIYCPQLLNLKVINATASACGNFMVFSPKICNFTSVGIFSIIFGVSQLENVYVRLRESTKSKALPAPTKLKQYFRQFLSMFPGFGSAKIISLDLETIKALSVISGTVVQFRSPFYNLKYLKLPHGCKESSIRDSIKSYLLDGSPRATIVTTLPQVVEVDPTAPVGGEGDDQVRSSCRHGDIGLWQGHKVNSEFIGLLDLIMKNYPETFKHFTNNTESKMFCSMKLNMLCSLINAFSKTPMTEVDDKMVTEYKVLFAGLQKVGFNVNWLVSHLNCIENMFVKSLLHELDVVNSHVKKMVPRGTKSVPRQTVSGTVHAVGNIGDYLFP